MYFSGSITIRCTSSGSLVSRLSAPMRGAPKVRLGTKHPSMTSTWTQSAPPASICAMCSARRPRSADRAEGAMRTVTQALRSGSLTDDQVHPRALRGHDAGAGPLIQHHPHRAAARGAGGDGAHLEAGRLETLPRFLLLQAAE